MIKASELRIGNRVRFINQSIIVHAGTIEDCDRANKSDAPYQYEPIPLTPEILEKAGFERWAYLGDNKYEFLICKARTLICYHEGNIRECSLYQDSKMIDLPASKVQYLHQLQNLYFALTGEELKIEL